MKGLARPLVLGRFVDHEEAENRPITKPAEQKRPDASDNKRPSHSFGNCMGNETNFHDRGRETPNSAVLRSTEIWE